MIRVLKAFSFTSVLIGFAFSAPNVKADPLWFSSVVALQNGGATQVDLFANPGVIIRATPQINFLVNITGTIPPGGGTHSLLLTYTEAGFTPITQTYAIPLFGTVNPPFTLLFNFGSSGGTNATLTVDLLGSSPDYIIPSGPNAGQAVNSYTYSFQVAPVPEPATLLLFGTGLVTLASRAHRRGRNKT